MPKFSQLLSWSLIIFFLNFNSGCSAINTFKKNEAQKKIDAEIKKNNYLALRKDVAMNILKNGTSAETIKAKYGSANDIFYSSSGVSNFQIWTYDIQKDKLSDTTLSPVILYLENGTLVNWKY